MPTKKQAEPTPSLQIKEEDIASIYEEKTKEVIATKKKPAVKLKANEKVTKNGNTITTS